MLLGPATADLPSADRKWANREAHSRLSAFFDRERAKKKKGRGTHFFSSDLLAGVLWDIRARQWIVALVSSSGDRNRGRKAGLVGRKQRRRKDAFSLASPFAARRRRRFVGVDFQSDDLFGLTLFSNLASVEQFPSNSSPTRAPLTQGELDWRRNRAESEREGGRRSEREEGGRRSERASIVARSNLVVDLVGETRAFRLLLLPEGRHSSGQAQPPSPQGPLGMPLGNSWSVIDEVDCGGAKPRGARAAAAKAAAKTATRGAAVKTPANARLPIQGRRFFRFKQEIKKQRRRREGKRQGDDARPTLFFFSLSFSKPQPRPLNFFTSTTTTTATSNTTSTTKNSDEENPYLRSGPPPPAPPPVSPRPRRQGGLLALVPLGRARLCSLLVGGLVVFCEALPRGCGLRPGRRVGLPTLAIGTTPPRRARPSAPTRRPSSAGARGGGAAERDRGGDDGSAASAGAAATPSTTPTRPATPSASRKRPGTSSRSTSSLCVRRRRLRPRRRRPRPPPPTGALLLLLRLLPSCFRSCFCFCCRSPRRGRQDAGGQGARGAARGGAGLDALSFFLLFFVFFCG